MAVTQNSYTGNGSTTNYSFTFPYLKQADIKCQLDSTVTTAFSLANATTVAFDTAPGNNVKIKIYRETDTDSAPATFYAGSSVKSEDLNDNFTQTLYTSQEVQARYLSNLAGTMVGDLTMGEDTTIIFEGATDDAYETTLTVVDPTADRTITIPNVSGTVVTTGDTATVTATMLAANSVDSSELVDGSVDNSHLADDAVNSDELASGAVDLDHMSANSVDSDQYVDGSIDLVHMSANSVDSDQYVDGSIDLVHMSANSVDSDQYVDGSIDLAHMSANSVDSDQYVDGSIDLIHMSANSVDSDQYVDGSIDNAHLADSSVTQLKIANNSVVSSHIISDQINASHIADDQIDSEHIAAGAVDLEHMSANSVDSDQYVDGSVDRIHLEADIIDSTKLADNAVGTEHIADAELTTLAGMQSGTASVLAGSTALTSTLSELNLLDGKSIVTSISSPTDVQLPTAQAVEERIVDLVTDVGGFRPIANETSFPTTNPDPEDNAGTIVSIKALASNLTSNGSGVATIANGAGSGNTVTINGMANSDTIEAGKGILVETTSTLHTYTFHRETLAPADITSAASAVSDFNERYRVNAGEPSSSLHEGDLVYDTNADKMKVYDSTTSAWKEVTSTGDFKYLFLCPAGGTGAPTLTNTTFDLREGSNSGSAASVTNAAQLLVSINGVVQKANTGTSAPAEGFAIVDANTIIFGAAPGAGANVFIHQAGSAVSIPTPGDDTVSEAKIQTNVVSEEKLKVSNAPTNTHVLTADATVSGGMKWAATANASPTTTRGDIIYRGASADARLAKGTAGQYLKIGANDPEWADVVGAVADGCIFENDQTISNNYTIASGKGAHSVGPITVNATVTVNGNWVVS